jgi:hypothetical protein
MTAGHVHRAMKSRSESWRGCVMGGRCFEDSEREAAHNFMMDTETCVCGAVRVTERGIDGTRNSTGWNFPPKSV